MYSIEYSARRIEKREQKEEIREKGDVRREPGESVHRPSHAFGTWLGGTHPGRAVPRLKGDPLPAGRLS